MTSTSICAACGKQDAYSPCPRCSDVKYCNASCQRDHWSSKHRCIDAQITAVSIDAKANQFLDWLRHRYKFCKDRTLPTQLQKNGFIEQVGGAFFFRTVVTTSLSSKHTKFPIHVLKLKYGDDQEGILHTKLCHGTKSAECSTKSPLLPIHAHWSENVSMTNVIMHHCDAEHRDTSEKVLSCGLYQLNKEIDVVKPTAGLDLTYTSHSVADLWTKVNARRCSINCIENMYIQIMASLAVLEPAKFTHTNLVARNLRLRDTRQQFASYLISDDEYVNVPLITNQFGRVVENDASVYMQAVISELDQAACELYGTNLMPIPAQIQVDAPASPFHWPNYANAGFDVWIMACDIVVNMHSHPPNILKAMVPTQEQYDRLLLHVIDHNIDRAVLQPMEMMIAATKKWTDLRLWDNVKQSLAIEYNTPRGYIKIPWPPEFYRSPMDALKSHGIVPATRPNPSAIRIQWNKE